METNFVDQIIQTFDDKENVKVRFNNSEYIEVNRQNLLESSSYFRNILSYNFRDHLSDFVEINYPASFETFKRAMQFVSNSNLDLKDENVFDTFELADYLQMDKLKKCCLDQFTSSLDRNNVETKFNQLKQFTFSVDEFKQRALCFIENTSCGLYFMQCVYTHRSSLIFFSTKNSTYREIGCHCHGKSVRLDLHHFNNTLVMCPSTKNEKGTESDMIMYDLITGKSNMYKLNFKGPVVNCSNEDNIFVFSLVKEKSEKQIFSIETFDIINYSEFHSTKKTIDSNLIEANEVLYFYFAHFFDNKIYVFYQTSDKDCNPYNNYMMIVCIKTMRILENINLADEELIFDDENIDEDDCKYVVRLSELYKSFYIKKENKLFLQLGKELTDTNFIIIFDIKNQQFLVKKDILQFKEDIVEEHDEVIAIKEDKFYGLFRMYDGEISHTSDSEDSSDSEGSFNKSHRVWEEIRTFKYENDILVETGLKWKSSQKRYRDWAVCEIPWVNSTLFIQNVKLN